MEKKRKQTVSKIVANSGWIISGRIIQMIITFFVGIFTARYLGPSNYGIINVAAAYTTFVLPFSTLGMSNTFVNTVLNHKGEDGKYLGSGLAIRIITSLIGILGINTFVVLLNPDNRTLHLVCFIHSFILLGQTFDLFDYWYQSRYESKYPAIIGIIGYAVSAVYKVFLLKTGKSVYWFAFATVLDYTIIALCYMFYTVPKNGITLKVSWKTAFAMLSESHHYIWSSVLVALYAHMDRIMIGKMMTDDMVGLYSVAVAICSLWTFILSAIINSFRPDIVITHGTDRDAYKEKIIQLYSIIIWTGIFASVIISLLAKYFILILYGYEYVGATNALRIVTWYSGITYLGVARNIWAVCEGKQKYEKYYAIAGALSNFVLNLIFIKYMGIEGAAIASLLTQAVTNIIVPYCISSTRENSVLIMKSFDIRYMTRAVRKLINR